MFTDDKMDAYDCLRVSKVLYEGLCSHIGTRTEVIIRRELMDMEEIIRNSKGVNEGTICMHSSSHREGFRLKSSDQDIMFGVKDIILSVMFQILLIFIHVQCSWNTSLLLRVL